MGRTVFKSENVRYTHVKIPHYDVGLTVCPGIAIGKPFYLPTDDNNLYLRYKVNGCAPDVGEKEFLRLIMRTQAELRGLQISMKEHMSEAGSLPTIITIIIPQ